MCEKGGCVDGVSGLCVVGGVGDFEYGDGWVGSGSVCVCVCGSMRMCEYASVCGGGACAEVCVCVCVRACVRHVCVVCVHV